jgi:AcrR family transcriptional regulator
MPLRAPKPVLKPIAAVAKRAPSPALKPAAAAAKRAPSPALKAAAVAAKPVPLHQRRVGRPPRLNTPAIIAAALKIGLDKVSFKQLAARLGVNVATLYRYVRNRNELVRLAAFQLTLSRRLPDQEYVHWSHLALRYAEEMFESFTKEPELVAALLKGSIGPQVEIDVLDQFLGAMSRYGFSPDQGLRLHRAIGIMTMGAATGAIGVKARQAAGTPWEVEILRTLIERADSDLPNVRLALREYLNFDEWRWLLSLQHLLTGIAAERGEELPAPQGRVAQFFGAAPRPRGRDPGA